VGLDHGARAQVVALEAARRKGHELARLREQPARLVLAAAQELAQRGDHLGPLLGRAPEQVLEAEQVAGGDGVASAEPRPRAEPREALAPAPVRDRDPLVRERAAQPRRQPQRTVGDEHALDLGLCRRELGERHALLRLARLGRAQHGEEAEVLADRLEAQPHEEAVVEGRELVLVGKLVGRADEAEQRHRDDVAAVVEAPLVEDPEQRVQDRARRLEHLVEEGHVRLGKLVRRHAPVLVALERRERDRAEQLLGRREAREQPVEVAGAVEAAAELLREHRLGGAGRAHEEHVLSREQRGERGVDRLVAFDEEPAQLRRERLEARSRRRRSPRSAGARRARSTGSARRSSAGSPRRACRPPRGAARSRAPPPRPRPS
jgi:hypothetical protein